MLQLVELYAGKVGHISNERHNVNYKRSGASPTHIPVKPAERFIPYGNVKQRVTENEALRPQNVMPYSGVPVTIDVDYTVEVECAYNIGRGNGIYGRALVFWVAGQVGISARKAQRYLSDKKLTKC